MRNEKDGIRWICCSVVSAFFFLVLAVVLKWNFLISVILTVGCFTALILLTKPRQKIGKIRVEEMINGEEAARKLEDAREDLHSIEKALIQITDPGLKADADNLYSTARDILTYLEGHPEKIMMARRYIDYYQDTASSLLNKYVELQNTRLNSEETRQLKNSTKNAVVMLNEAFGAQFQKLLNNELMDMDAEINLIEKTMKMEGLS